MEPRVATRFTRDTVLVDRYRLGQLIARGGMGEVYEAIDERLRRRVAVKVFPAGPDVDRARFDREVRLLASLDHPGIVRLFDAGEDAGHAFVVLELIDGPTLAEAAGGRPMPSDRVARLGQAVAAALSYLHERGVVHRDVTPTNILCGADGRTRLADFGIARLLDGTRLTATATTIGTAAYMAPEQVQGRDVDGAADIYALGLVLLELLTGRRPFEGQVHEVAVARLARSPDTTLVPGPWRDLLRAMTGLEAADRPSAAEVIARLDGVLVATAQPEEGTGATPTVVVGGAAFGGPGADELAPVSPSAPTGVMPAADGGTQVLPAVLVPEVPELPSSRWAPIIGSVAGWVWARRALLAVVAGLAALLIVAVSVAGDDGSGVPPPSTEPAAATPSTTVAPTTTSPPTTEAPSKEDKGEGRGRDKGKGNGQDD